MSIGTETTAPKDTFCHGCGIFIAPDDPVIRFEDPVRFFCETCRAKAWKETATEMKAEDIQCLQGTMCVHCGKPIEKRERALWVRNMNRNAICHPACFPEFLKDASMKRLADGPESLSGNRPKTVSQASREALFPDQPPLAAPRKVGSQPVAGNQVPDETEKGPVQDIKKTPAPHTPILPLLDWEEFLKIEWEHTVANAAARTEGLGGIIGKDNEAVASGLEDLEAMNRKADLILSLLKAGHANHVMSNDQSFNDWLEANGLPLLPVFCSHCGEVVTVCRCGF